MELVTGYGGKAHITPENWADLNRGFSGAESYVMETGRKFEAELVSNNLLKIHDGCGIMQGRQVVIPKGQSDEVTIQNGTQGMKRIDLVVERYTKNPDTKIETTETVIIKGTPSTNPTVPSYTVGDIRSGDMKADWPLYEVELNGINVVEVRPVFKTLVNMTDIQQMLAELNSKLSFELGNKYLKLENGLAIQWGDVVSGENNYATINFEVPFIDKDYSLIASPQYLNNQNITFEVSCQKISNKNAYLYTRISNGTSGIHPAHVNWIAIGKWK